MKSLNLKTYFYMKVIYEELNGHNQEFIFVMKYMVKLFFISRSWFIDSAISEKNKDETRFSNKFVTKRSHDVS